MRLNFQTTDTFEQDLQSFPAKERQQIAKRIQLLGEAFRSGRHTFAQYARQVPMRLQGGLESTLCVARVDRRVRILLAADEDPLFDEMLITLLRVIPRSQLWRDIQQIAAQLYSDPATSIESLEDIGDGPE